MKSSLKKKIASFVGAENLDFLKHTGNYLSGTVVRNVLLALSLPVFTHLLTPDEYGVLSIFSSVVALLVILVGLNINSGITRYYLEKKEDFAQALGSNLVYMVGLGAIVLLGLFLFSKPLADFCRLEEEVFWYAALVGGFSVPMETYMALLNASQRSKRYSVLLVLRTAFTLVMAVSLIVLLEENKYLGKVYADLAIIGLFSMYAFGSLAKMSKFQVSSKYIKYTLRFSIPLIPHAMSRFVLGYFDRIIVRQLTGATETGLYSFAYDVGMAMNLIVMATVRAWRPIFYDEYREENFEKIARMVKDYANYTYLIALGIILYAADVIWLLADEKFHESAFLVPIVVLGYVFVFLYTLYFQYSSYLKRTELISANTFVAGAANIGLNYLTIPIYGYEAAAYTTLGSFGLLFFLHYLNARFVLKANVIPLRTVMPNLLLLCLVTALYMTLFAMVDSYPILAGARLATLGAALYLFVRGKRKRMAP